MSHVRGEVSRQLFKQVIPELVQVFVITAARPNASKQVTGEGLVGPFLFIVCMIDDIGQP